MNEWTKTKMNEISETDNSATNMLAQVAPRSAGNAPYAFLVSLAELKSHYQCGSDCSRAFAVHTCFYQRKQHSFHILPEFRSKKHRTTSAATEFPHQNPSTWVSRPIFNVPTFVIFFNNNFRFQELRTRDFFEWS